MKQPMNPPRAWNTQEALEYLNRLHDDLYPRRQAWNPNTSGVTGSVTAGYVRQGGFISVSVVVTGPTTSTSGEFSIPFPAALDYVLNVQAGALLLPATVQKGSSTVVLPDWNEAGNVIISGFLAV